MAVTSDPPITDSETWPQDGLAGTGAPDALGIGEDGVDVSGGPERILLVASPGGHLMQMVALRPAWEDLECRWVSLESADSKFLLDPSEVVFAYGPTPRNVPNFFRNLRLAWTTIRQYKPDVILSTGAGLAVPFFVIGRLCGVRLVYVESFTRVKKPALTGRMVYPLAHVFFVQWPTSYRRRRAIYAGSVV
jgi:beta-1,4-N-acetylglucosaminyltransferase